MRRRTRAATPAGSDRAGATRPDRAGQRQRLRPYVTTGVALIGASAIAVTPTTLPDTKITAVEADAVLTASSYANIPLNLFNAVLSVPANQVLALDRLASSLLFADNWYVPSAANIWGIDVGDPPKIAAAIAVLSPFPAFSDALAYQIVNFVAAEVPPNPACSLDGCPPFVVGTYGPPERITGIDWLDRGLWTVAVLTGARPFPLFDSLFRVPITELMAGYTFDADYPGYTNGGTGPYDPGFGFPGTKPGPNGEALVPWADETFYLDPSAPIRAFIEDLMEEPTGVVTVTPKQVVDTFVSLFASQIVAFNVYAPGSPGCPAPCEGPLTTRSILQGISKIFPDNAYIKEWLIRDELRPPPPEPPRMTLLGTQPEDADEVDTEQPGEEEPQEPSDDTALLRATTVDPSKAPVLDIVPEVTDPTVTDPTVVEQPGTEEVPPATPASLPTGESVVTPEDPSAVPPEEAATPPDAPTAPVRTGPKHAKPAAGLDDALKKIGDRVNRHIAKATDALKGNGSKAGKTPETEKPADTGAEADTAKKPAEKPAEKSDGDAE